MKKGLIIPVTMIALGVVVFGLAMLYSLFGKNDGEVVYVMDKQKFIEVENCLKDSNLQLLTIWKDNNRYYVNLETKDRSNNVNSSSFGEIRNDMGKLTQIQVKGKDRVVFEEVYQ